MILHAIGMFVAGALLAEGGFFWLFSAEIDQRRARQSAERGLDYPRKGNVAPRTLGAVLMAAGVAALVSNLPFFL